MKMFLGGDCQKHIALVGMRREGNCNGWVYKWGSKWEDVN